MAVFPSHFHDELWHGVCMPLTADIKTARIETETRPNNRSLAMLQVFARIVKND